jgi:hypothetical protein
MTRRRRLRSTLKLIIAFVALVGQSAFVSISASADEAGAAAHVESKGVSLHHAHNEATCVTCRVLSLHGRAETQQTVSLAIVIGAASKPGVASRRPEQAALPGNLSRAPPGNA